jgi:hypothetical protein
MALGAVGLGTAACGSNTTNTADSTPPTVHTSHTHHTSAPPTTQVVVTTPVVTQTATQSSDQPTTSAPSVEPCSTADLSLSVGQVDGAAGNLYYPLILTNAGGAPCTLAGYPGVSFTDASGTQIGPSAARRQDRYATVTLPASGQASALLHQPDPNNFPSGSCRIAEAQRIRVYPPGQTGALSARFHEQVCSVSGGASRTDVGPLQSGTDPQP